MNKIKSNQKNSKSLRPSKKRGTSEIIAALLLVAITVVGAVILTVFLDDNFVAASENEASKQSSSKFIRLLGYDTRDSVDLFQLDKLDNNFDGNLLGVSAATGDEDKIPVNGGTEFLVIQVQNEGIDPVWLSDVYIDGVEHDWDLDTDGKELDATSDDLPGDGKYPDSGKFSIMSSPSTDQKTDNQIVAGETVNIIVKLSKDIDDIDLNKKIRILLNVGANQLVDFIIESGDAK